MKVCAAPSVCFRISTRFVRLFLGFELENPKQLPSDFPGARLEKEALAEGYELPSSRTLGTGAVRRLGLTAAALTGTSRKMASAGKVTSYAHFWVATQVVLNLRPVTQQHS